MGKEKDKGETNMKKILIALLALVMLLTTVACKASETPQETVPDEPAAQPEVGAVTGGWTPAEDYSINNERKAIFDKGMATLLGVDYAPLAYLGSQVVAGKNHVFLAKGTAVITVWLEEHPKVKAKCEVTVLP